MSAPDLLIEAGLAGEYPSQRFGQRERKLLESVKEFVGFQVVAAGTHTTVGGSAAEAIAIDGLLATDLAFIQMHTQGVAPVTVLAASCDVDEIDVTFSADPDTDHVVAYQVIRPL